MLRTYPVEAAPDRAGLGTCLDRGSYRRDRGKTLWPVAGFIFRRNAEMIKVIFRRAESALRGRRAHRRTSRWIQVTPLPRDLAARPGEYPSVGYGRPTRKVPRRVYLGSGKGGGETREMESCCGLG